MNRCDSLHLYLLWDQYLATWLYLFSSFTYGVLLLEKFFCFAGTDWQPHLVLRLLEILRVDVQAIVGLLHLLQIPRCRQKLPHPLEHNVTMQMRRDARWPFVGTDCYIALHPSLSSNMGVGPPATSLKLVSSCLRKTASQADAAKAMYSASGIESATDG